MSHHFGAWSQGQCIKDQTKCNFGLCLVIDLLCSEKSNRSSLVLKYIVASCICLLFIFCNGFSVMLVNFRKRMMRMKMRVRRKRQTARRKTTQRSLRLAPSSIGKGPSRLSSLPCPLRHRPSQSHHLRLFRPPLSPSSPCRTTTPPTTQGAPARSCSGYWWDSRCSASSNRVNSCLG